MEPHATVAAWDADGALTLYETTQHIFGAKELVSIVLGVPLEKITVVSHFLGGGFGGKAYVWPHTLLTAIAARALNRPVRIQLTRAQMYSMVGHQPATIQTIELAADGRGKLTGIRHESTSPTPVFDNYIEYAAMASRHLWAAGAGIATNHKVVHVNATRRPRCARHTRLSAISRSRALWMNWPTQPSSILFSCACSTTRKPTRSFSTRAIRKCLAEGGARFSWDKRTPVPRSMRDGRYLIGQGMAGAIYTHWRWPANARVTLKSDGSALVEAGVHELGTGTYTVMQQVAADALGLAPEKVTVRLGDTRLPASHASIGSATMANAGASVMLAANAVRDKAIELALAGREPLGAGSAPGDIVVDDGTLSFPMKNASITYAELLARNTMSELVADGNYDPVEEANGPKAVFSFAAVFAEVRVDPDLGLVRLNRFVGAYDAGRIINPKTARSQAIGGIIWGVGQALLEQSETDPTTGRYLSRNYSGYLVPTNADVPEIEVLFVGEFDQEASPLGAKGLGELTAVSVAPAIANAVYHATGKRIRDLPITVEMVL
jgi:xanthine dehydrogenase YagR molybdenum-binding subunit